MGDQTRPHVHTPPPGPRSRSAPKRGEDIMLGVSLIGDWPPSHFVSRYRDGWFLEDVDGNRYLDWLAGWASSPLGGNHPELVEAAHTALKEYGTECLSSLTRVAPVRARGEAASRSRRSRSARSSTTPPAARSSRTPCASCARPPVPAARSSSPSWAASTAATTAPAPWARTSPITTTPSSRS